MDPLKGKKGQSNSTNAPDTMDELTAKLLPRRQCRPNRIAGKKQAAYKLPENDVKVTIPPGGRSDISAVIIAPAITYVLVARTCNSFDLSDLFMDMISL